MREAAITRTSRIAKVRMPTLTLDDDELRALCDLLTDVTRQPNRFPLSPKRRAWLSALERLTKAAEEEPRPKARRVKDPA